MGFWWFMFLCDLLIPFIMIISGKMMWKHPPKSINAVMGYRTKRSMRNMDTWNFAHEHCGRLWWRIGWAMLIPSAVIHLPFYNSSENMIGTVGGILCTIQCLALIVSILPTEKALKRNFTDEGLGKEEKRH